MSNTPTYGPYGNPGGLPAFIGGIDDGESLRLAAITSDSSTDGWYPQLHPGRYNVSSETGFRYEYARPQTVGINLTSAGRVTQLVNLPTASYAPKAFIQSPLRVQDSGGNNFNPVCQNVRFAYPVHSLNTAVASSFVDPAYLSATGSTTSPLQVTDTLWWQPTFGAEVIAVRRSRNARSYDVLADPDSLLSRVDYPDQLIDDRCFCVDFNQGLVYGKVAAQTLPPPPFSSGAIPMTYVTLAYPTESDPTLSGSGTSLANNTYWTSYFAARTSFYTQFEGSTGYSYYDPLRLEEICVVDRDGMIRLRRVPSNATGYQPSVVFIAPDGFVTCSVQTVSGNTVDALIQDVTQDNALVAIPYGATVIVRYWVNNTYTVSALLGGPLVSSEMLRAYLSTFSTTAPATGGTLTYETDPDGAFMPFGMNGSAPDLNPLTNQTRSGFLWFEDASNPVSPAATVSGRLEITNPRPIYDSGVSHGETFMVRATAFDYNGVEVCGATLHLNVAPANSFLIEANNRITGADGFAYFRVTMNTAGLSSAGATLSLVNTLATGITLASVNVLPANVAGADSYGLTNTWEPSIFISLGESYRTIGSDDNAVERRYVRVLVVQPDGFPWGRTQNVLGGRTPQEPYQIVLTSSESVFHNPVSGGDTPLGAQVIVQYGDTSGLISTAGIMTVGYEAVVGDTLVAQLFLGEDRYVAAPVYV